jgi:hypothetical protein
MGSRFTEHFEINENFQISQSEPSSPLLSTFDSFFSSSSETLNFQVTASSSSTEIYSFKSKSQTSVKSNDPSLIHSHSFSIVNFNEDSFKSLQKPKKSKLKRFLTTIHHSRKSNK